MSTFQGTIRRAQRRVFIDRVIWLCGWGVASGLVLGLLILGIDRFLGLELPARMLLYPAFAGIAAGLITALLMRPDPTHTAIRLDRELRLKDRMGTAQSLEGLALPANHDPEFAALVELEAQRIAGGVDLKYATPIRVSGVWALATVLAAALWIGHAFIPELNWATQDRSAQSNIQTTQIIQQQAQEFSQSIDQVVQELPVEQLDAQTAEQLATLDRLAEQLGNPNAKPEELDAAQDESAARLDEIADRLAEKAQRDQAAADELARRFQGMDSISTPKPPLSLQQFTEALKRGEFGEAAKELDDLLKATEDLPPAQRKATADELRRLAEQIEQIQQEQSPDSTELREGLEQALRDQGLEEQSIDQLLENPPSAEEIERELQRNNIDPEVAREMARDVQKMLEQQRIEDQAQRDSEDVADSLDRAADDLETQESPPQTQPSTRPQQPTPPQTQPQAKPESSTDQPPDKTQSGETSDNENSTLKQSQQQQIQKQQGSEERPSESPQADRSQTQQTEKPDDQRTADQQQQNQQGQSQQQPNQQRGDQQKGEQQQATTQADSQSPQAQRQPSDNTQSQQTTDPDEEPSADKGQAPAQKQDQTGDQPKQSQSPNEKSKPEGQSPQQRQQGSEQSNDQNQQKSPSQLLRELAERRDGESGKQQAERLRQLAREMSDNMTPQQREQWARQWQQQNQPQDRPQSPASHDETQDDQQRIAGGSRADDGKALPDLRKPDQPPSHAETDKVDLRGDEPANQLITQWLTGEHVEPSGGAAPVNSAQRIRQAQEIAERAVNDSAVQKRYHKMIKRYFNRLPQTIERAGSPAAQNSSPAAPPAPSDQ
jgi:hypothetical protein